MLSWWGQSARLGQRQVSKPTHTKHTVLNANALCCSMSGLRGIRPTRDALPTPRGSCLSVTEYLCVCVYVAGGLGDVMFALPKALQRRGHRVMVVVPRYANYEDAWETGVRIKFLCMGYEQVRQQYTLVLNFTVQVSRLATLADSRPT